MRFILSILLLPNLAFALNGSFEASNNITGQADAIYLKLDASNDPLTGTLSGTNLIMSGTATIQGNAFSVGGSTFVVSQGRVLIGSPNVTAANGMFGIKQSAQGAGIFTQANATDAFLRIRHTDSVGLIENSYVATAGYTPLQIHTGGISRIAIDTTGNVGIGTTAPPAKLSVSTATTSVSFYSIGGAKTKAEILAFDPVGPGESFYCTDCVAAMVCVSTGTAVTQFADIGDRTVACN